MNLKNRAYGKRLLSVLLAVIMMFTLFPASTFAEGRVTKDVNPLLVEAVLDGVTKDDDGTYHVLPNKSYDIKLTFRETKTLEMDMEDYIYFQLPDGVIPSEAGGTIDIGVEDADGIRHLLHPYSIEGNTLKITWNQHDDEDPEVEEIFKDLALAHYVEFTFDIQAQFDDTMGMISFGDGGTTVIKVDNTGSITIDKAITGLKDYSLSETEKQAMTFELRRIVDGEEPEVVIEFSYADMTTIKSDGTSSITFDGMDPGDYEVVETGRPSIADYEFNTNGSILSHSGTLNKAGKLDLALKNSYNRDTGSLVLNKIANFTYYDGTTSTTVPDNMKDKISFHVEGPGCDETHTYADFTNGKLELSVEIGEYTITETNSITGFTWTHTVNSDPETLTATATVEKGKTASANFINNYEQKTADLKIKKTSSGATVPGTATFKVTFPDGTEKTVTYSQIAAAGGEYTFKDVPLGTYNVVEDRDSAHVDNYALTVTGEGDVTLSTEGGSETITINNAYVPRGVLTINKNLTGVDADALSDAQKAAMVFVVKDKISGTEVGRLTYAQILSGTKTLDVPAGTYIVEEQNAPAITGYTLDTATSTQTVDNVSVSTGGTASASFTNNYTKDDYKLTVRKSFGNGTDLDTANLPDYIREDTKFTVTDKTTNKPVVSCSLEELATTLNGLAMSGPGPYIITEANPQDLASKGIGVLTSVIATGVASSSGTGSSIEVTLDNHLPATVSFTNIYTIQGNLSVTKTVNGLPEYEETDLKENKLLFTIYRKEGNNYEVFQDNLKLADLEAVIVPAGEYYVQEAGVLTVDGFGQPVVTSQVNGGEVKTGDQGSASPYFEIEQGGSALVHFTNTYAVGEGGEVRFKKFVKGLDEIVTDAEDGFVELDDTLDVINTDGEKLYDGISFLLQDYKTVEGVSDWRDYATYSLEEMLTGNINLRPGKYRITEQGGDVASYSLHVDYTILTAVTGEVQQTGESQIEFEIEKGKTLQLEARNVYSKLGNLIITKTVAGDLVTKYKSYLSTSRSTVKFHVEGPFNFVDDFTFDDIAAAKANYAVKTYENIPVGKYYVTETASDITNYTVTKTVAAAAGTTETADGGYVVPIDGTAQVNFTNDYNRKKGNLTVTKKMTGQVPAFTENQKKAMSFQLKNSSDTVLETVYFDNFVAGEVDGTYTYTFTNLDIGNYTVTESIGSALSSNYNITISGDNKKSVSVSATGGTAAITNKFQEVGTLKLIKNFTGASIDDNEKKTLEFEYYKVNASGTEVSGTRKTVKYTSFKNGSYSVKVTPGNYVVLEKDTATGYTRTTKVSVNDGTAADGMQTSAPVAFGETTAVNFTNNYVEKASLTIEKAVAGDLLLNGMSDDQKKAISFTVKNSSNDTIREFTLYDLSGEPLTITDLPIDNYTVTETVDESNEALFGAYTRTTTYSIDGAANTTGESVTFTAHHGANNVLFTNHYDGIDALSVVKTSNPSSYADMVKKNDVKYPVWRFDLKINNLNTLTTHNGTTTFTDVFDTAHPDWFRLATESEIAGIDSNGNYYITSDVEGKEPPHAVFMDDNSIFIDNITDETADQCTFTYYLIIANDDALKAISTLPEGAESAAGLSYSFENVVTYHPRPYSDATATSKAPYVYSFTALDKGITNVDENGQLYELKANGEKRSVNYALYSITLNEDGVSIGTASEITVVDKFSDNQSVVVSSVVTDPKVNAYVDNEAHTITFIIKNGTPVHVTYKANIENGSDKTVRLENNVTLLGFMAGIDQFVDRAQSGSGGGTVYSLNITKASASNDSTRLSDVEFYLYDGETNELLADRTTNANGQIQIKEFDEGGSFMVDHDYYLIEQNTLPGYNLDSTKIWLRFTDEGPSHIDNGVHVLKNGGELVVHNEPVTAAPEVTKSFNAWDKQGSFTFKLVPVGTAPMPVNAPEIAFVTVTQSNPTASFGDIHFEDGVGTYKYFIQEVVDPDNMVDGVYYDTTAYPVTVVVSDENKDGKKEVAVTYGENNEPSLTVTNLYDDTVEVSGSKTWIDANNQDGMRPESITIKLYKNDATKEENLVDSKKVTADDNGKWSWSFTDLYKYEDGKEIKYIIVEDAVVGYKATYDGYNVTNTHEPTKVRVSGSKTWNDDDDRDGLRPDSITIKLYKNDATVEANLLETKDVTAENGWTWDFGELDEYENGQKIKYIITENAVPEYTTEYSETGYNVTNIHTPEITSVSGSKTWADDNDRDGMRPDSITVHLLKNGVPFDSQNVSADDKGNWSWSFTGLYAYEDGEPITYSVSEDAVKGYTPSVSGYNITNTHEPDTIKVSGTKSWNDANDQDGMRPKSITVNLLKNGNKIDYKNVSADDNWSWDFGKLYTHENGQPVTYTVEEEPVEGYTASPSTTDYGIINTHTPGVVSVFGSKTWNDDDDRDGLRPDSITIKLYKNDETVEANLLETKVVTAEDGWSWDFGKLDEFENGQKIKYIVKEDPVEYYETECDGYNVTNTHTPATTSVSGSKTWSDNNNRDGMRPDSITVNLLKNGVPVDSQNVSADDKGNWSWSFTGLYAYEDGEPITYSVKENDVTGYTPTYSEKGYDITNSHTPKTTYVSGSKTWDDNDNQDGKRPSSITIKLYKNDAEKEENLVDKKVVSADDSGNWSWNFTGLYEYENGQKITYIVRENTVSEYNTTYDGYNVTNTHAPEKTTISGSKTWDDAGNQDGKRPGSITVRLYKNDATVEANQLAYRVVTAENGWSWDFGEFDVYEGGQKIKYIIVEDPVAGYAPSYSTTDYNVTNTHAPEQTTVSGSKTWSDAGNRDGKRPSSIIVKLYKNDAEKEENLVDKKVVTADDGWSWSFTGLDKFKNGQEITYIIRENAVPEYTTEYSETGYNVTNTHVPETVNVSGSKTWSDDDNRDGMRPDSIIVNLLKNGEPFDSTTVSADDGWSWSFNDLYAYENGEPITYSVTENDVEGYTPTYSKTDYNIINTHTPGTVTVSGSKTWDDAGNQDGKRPSSITVNLLKNGEPFDSKVVTADDNWSWSFTGLYEYENGKEITYSVTENDVPEYTPTYSDTGYDITNSHTPETTYVSGTKTWDDAGNQDGKRPSSITINLLKNGEPFDSKVVTADDNWSWSFTGLDKYEAGQEIIYTITENAVQGYSTRYDGFNVTNSYTPGKVSVSVMKSWKDYNDQDGIRPSEITVKLLADGEYTGKTLVLNQRNTWRSTFTDLDEYKSGVKIVYTIEEVNVPGYRSVISGTAADSFVITNSHTPETTYVSGSKTWNDADNQDGKRPSSITINLLKNGKTIDSKVVTANDNWSWSFTGLEAYEDGELINYTITEDAVRSYTATYNGYNVTNSYTPGKISVSVMKSWKDNNDQDGIRPKEIKVKLLADGKDTGEELILNLGNNWSGTFSAHDMYKSGTKIIYTVEEVDVPDGYKAAISGTAADGFIITNSHTPAKPPYNPDIPRTGDNNYIFYWAALWLVSVGALTGSVVRWKKRKKAK